MLGERRQPTLPVVRIDIDANPADWHPHANLKAATIAVANARLNVGRPSADLLGGRVHTVTPEEPAPPRYLASVLAFGRDPPKWQWVVSVSHQSICGGAEFR
ncbi:Uncharacterised protein [Mycobacteroides abscessus subsp. abscessus]|nr:Uncharacterised protein [Mycobacteroides abscessus subsp. abscessus]SIB77272.1 Uncharacterised protein [Mycobacteroides abscessus subsp. abscessus]SIC02958.1 Uncharacterised protein [Mycobacteroides abscessus subsp. abscessus]SID72635.1 Uncharacterised protein [Mycobacteroides abscessus subsp. abscessus]SIE99424.1 Uncharacterised protein [Mycobacteroides abscessus subsp. abscessus]